MVTSRSVRQNHAASAASSTAFRTERMVSRACGRSLWIQHVNGLPEKGTFASLPFIDVTISDATTFAVLGSMSERGTLPADLTGSKRMVQQVAVFFVFHQGTYRIGTVWPWSSYQRSGKNSGTNSTP